MKITQITPKNANEFVLIALGGHIIGPSTQNIVYAHVTLNVKTIPQNSDELSQYFPHPVFGQNGGVTFLPHDNATYCMF